MKVRVRSTVMIDLDRVPEDWTIPASWQEQAKMHGVTVESFSIESVSEN